ncbi:hypothetical protein, partial [Burkholderia cepacia]|uniref:hypothetical protein n=1 Tax=Burkholderia cepacia TaxID=292 RepID=UPI002FE074CA
GDFQSPRLSPDEPSIQPIEASQLAFDARSASRETGGTGNGSPVFAEEARGRAGRAQVSRGPERLRTADPGRTELLR